MRTFSILCDEKSNKFSEAEEGIYFLMTGKAKCEKN